MPRRRARRHAAAPRDHRALLATTDHPRAETIFAAVRQRHPHISLATVHRTLETLCEIGEARKVTTLHDSARYDGNLAPHHHVVCVRCRRIRDIEIPGLEHVLERATLRSKVSSRSDGRSKSRRCATSAANRPGAVRPRRRDPLNIRCELRTVNAKFQGSYEAWPV